MSKKIILVLTVILLAGIAGTQYYLKRINTEEIVIENREEEKVPQFKTFKSDKYGFSFSYPDDYVLTDKEVGDSNRRYNAVVLIHKNDAAPRPNGEGPTAITIDVYPNIEGQTVLEWLTFSNQSNYNLKKAPYAPTSLGGEPGITYKWSGLYEGQTVAFNYEDFIVAMSVTYFEESDKIVKDFEKVKSTFSFQKRSYSNEEVSNYLKANISTLSPVKETLGGKFFVTDFEFTGRTTGRVFYEDGHNAYVSKFTLSGDSAGKIKATLKLEE